MHTVFVGMFELTSASTKFMPPKAQLMKAKAVEARMVANLCFLQLRILWQTPQGFAIGSEK
jgi:hypothetical protein